MRTTALLEWFLDLPYRLPQRTVNQRLLKVSLFPVLFLVAIVGLLVSSPLSLIALLVNFIRDGDA